MHETHKPSNIPSHHSNSDLYTDPANTTAPGLSSRTGRLPWFRPGERPLGRTLIRRPAVGVCAAEGVGAVGDTAHSRCAVEAGAWLAGWVCYLGAVGVVALGEGPNLFAGLIME